MGPVDDPVDHRRIFMIGNCHAVDIQERSPHGAALDRNAVDVGRSCSSRPLAGDLAQIGSRSLTLDFADEYFGESGVRGRNYAGAGIARLDGIVDRERRLVQIALELESGS